MSAGEPLLNVRGLTLADTRAPSARPVADDVSFGLLRGASLALCDPEGTAATALACAVAAVPDAPLERLEGSIELRTADGVAALERRTEHGLVELHGAVVGAMLWDGDGLDPLHPVLRQIERAAAVHVENGASAQTSAGDALAAAGLDRADARHRPGDLDAERRSRGALALALAGGPSLLVADDPGRALDPPARARLGATLAALASEAGIALLVATRDLRFAARCCDRVAVLHAGQIVETGPSRSLLRAPEHPYVHALARALEPDAAHAPDAAPPAQREGCRYAPACAQAREACSARIPDLRALDPEHAVRCLFAPWPPGALDERAQAEETAR